MPGNDRGKDSTNKSGNPVYPDFRTFQKIKISFLFQKDLLRNIRAVNVKATDIPIGFKGKKGFSVFFILEQ